MIWSSAEGASFGNDAPVTGAPVRWSPEELSFGGLTGFESDSSLVGAAEREELIEAIAKANREREALDEAERRAADAYARGFEAGRSEAAAAEAARLRTAMTAAEDALESFRSTESRWRGALEENICALAIAVAKQILERELRGSPRVVSELVRRAVTEFPIDQPIRIRVAPSDLAMITAAGADGAASPLTMDREARWIADPLISPGGCVVEGRERIIDGRVDSALERLYRRLTHTSR